MVGKRLTSTSEFKVGDTVSMLFDEGDQLRWKGIVISKKGKSMVVKCGNIYWTVHPSSPHIHIRKVKRL